MQQLVSDNLWPEIKKLAKKSMRRLAAVAYVTTDEYIRFRRNDILVVDASDERIHAGNTSSAILRAAFNRGVQLFSVRGLHAKVFVFDRTAVIGSANVSDASISLIEAGIITNEHGTVAQSASLIHQLAERGTRIDDSFLTRIEAIKVSPRRSGRKRRRRTTSIGIAENRTWLVNVTEQDEEKFPDEQELAEAGERKAEQFLNTEGDGVSWMRWTGSSKFQREARQGDSVIQVWRPQGGKRRTVYRPSPILYRQDEKNCTRFYVIDADDDPLTFTAFKTLAKRVGLSGKIGPYSCREINPDHARAFDVLWSI